jgi:hypothetical protein
MRLDLVVQRRLYGDVYPGYRVPNGGLHELLRNGHVQWDVRDGLHLRRCHLHDVRPLRDDNLV